MNCNKDDWFKQCHPCREKREEPLKSNPAESKSKDGKDWSKMFQLKEKIKPALASIGEKRGIGWRLTYLLLLCLSWPFRFPHLIVTISYYTYLMISPLDFKISAILANKGLRSWLESTFFSVGRFTFGIIHELLSWQRYISFIGGYLCIQRIKFSWIVECVRTWNFIKHFCKRDIPKSGLVPAILVLLFVASLCAEVPLAGPLEYRTLLLRTTMLRIGTIIMKADFLSGKNFRRYLSVMGVLMINLAGSDPKSLPSYFAGLGYLMFVGVGIYGISTQFTQHITSNPIPRPICGKDGKDSRWIPAGENRRVRRSNHRHEISPMSIFSLEGPRIFSFFCRDHGACKRVLIDEMNNLHDIYNLSSVIHSAMYEFVLPGLKKPPDEGFITTARGILFFGFCFVRVLIDEMNNLHDIYSLSSVIHLAMCEFVLPGLKKPPDEGFITTARGILFFGFCFVMHGVMQKLQMLETQKDRNTRHRRHQLATALSAIDGYKKSKCGNHCSFDIDSSTTVVLDNSATCHVFKDKDLFISEIQDLTPDEADVEVKTIGAPEKPAGKGSIRLRINDNDGNTHVETIHDVYYFPDSPVNIIGVPYLSKQRKDFEGTHIWTTGSYSIFTWNFGKQVRRFLHPMSGLPELTVNEGTNCFSVSFVQGKDIQSVEEKETLDACFLTAGRTSSPISDSSESSQPRIDNQVEDQESSQTPMSSTDMSAISDGTDISAISDTLGGRGTTEISIISDGDMLDVLGRGTDISAISDTLGRGTTEISIMSDGDVLDGGDLQPIVEDEEDSMGSVGTIVDSDIRLEDMINPFSLAEDAIPPFQSTASPIVSLDVQLIMT